MRLFLSSRPSVYLGAITVVCIGSSAFAACTTISIGTITSSPVSYSPATPGDTAFTFTANISCTSGSGGGNFTAWLGGSGGATVTSTSPISNPRTMRLVGSAQVLNYNIYTINGGSSIWGNGTAGTFTVGGNISNTSSLTGYGRIFSGQYIKPGNYTDTLNLVIDY
ncbi:spore coat U domain-containing protein (plasmid) [Deinococcus taeanensis]|uniref:spore coat protein U domain-containing protein n=1 Tax=Deinococcus taeanensis TaxID=2737050 RepID=UPI001CDD107A|nr:spore coat U domain-containing protein [Deinococcus taeanensis]